MNRRASWPSRGARRVGMCIPRWKFDLRPKTPVHGCCSIIAALSGTRRPARRTGATKTDGTRYCGTTRRAPMRTRELGAWCSEKFTNGGEFMRLYVLPPSPRALKVIALKNHLGLDCEMHNVDLGKGDQLTPEYIAMN